MTDAGSRGARNRRQLLDTLVMAFALSGAVSMIVSSMTVAIFTWSDSASEEGHARQVALWETRMSLPCGMQMLKVMTDSVGESADFRRGFTVAKEAGERAFPETAEHLAEEEAISDRIRGKQAVLVLAATGILAAVVLYRSYQLKKARQRIAALEHAAATD